MYKNTREISVQIISKIYNDQSFENAINKNPDYRRLLDKDKSLVRMIILTFLRRNGEIDHIIKKYLKKSLDKKIMNILRIGATQILFLNIPDYSSINISVNLSKKNLPKLSGLVNAVLRNISKNKINHLNEVEPIMNLPKWIKENWIENYGKEKTEKFAGQFIKKPPIDINIKQKRFNERDWEKTLNGDLFFKKILRLRDSEKIKALPFFEDGFWWVQSAAASIPVEIINKLFEKRLKEQVHVLEVGAAPGGKTCQLCDYNYNVTAIEVSNKRIKLLKENLHRLNFSPKVINLDILSFNTDKKFDSILIDSPCSASGIISKNPDILIRKKEDILKQLLKKQMKILEKCSSLIKVKGIIVYTVCSLISDEGKKQIKNFLTNNKGFKIKKISKKILEDLEYKLSDGMLTIKPDDYIHKGGMDGFFVACIEKIEV